MANKITKVQMFGMIRDLGEVAAHPEMVEFIDHEIELLKKKANDKKPTKSQKENESIKAEILVVLESGSRMTATEIMNDMTETYSIQKITALLRGLISDGLVEKTVEKKKKKSYFSLVKAEDETE